MGLDVGYGTRRTCGLAILADQPELAQIFPHRARYVRRYERRSGGVVETVTLRKGEVEAQAAELRRLLGLSILVVDGMLAPGGRPTAARLVDSRCMAGEFQNRAVPASVTGGGKALVDATYELVEAIIGDGLGDKLAFSPAEVAGRAGPLVLETNPTVGLATSVPMIRDVTKIPSRGIGGGAKSDFYWGRGGGDRVAAVLGAVSVAAERNHELRAGLYALAVAVQVAGAVADGSKPTFIGDRATGVYVLLGPVHADWEAAVRAVGIVL